MVSAMMKVITGEKFITDQGLIVICDPRSIKDVIVPGEHVLCDGEEYVMKGVVQSMAMTDKWPVLLAER